MDLILNNKKKSWKYNERKEYVIKNMYFSVGRKFKKNCSLKTNKNKMFKLIQHKKKNERSIFLKWRFFFKY